MTEAADTRPRVVCQVSCGAASAVATKLALVKYGATHEVVLVNAYIEEEHKDNRRFLADLERWFGRAVTVLRDTKYGASTLEVWRRKRYMKGQKGAPCSAELKRKLLNGFRQPGDILIFGYTVEEQDRAWDFKAHHPDIHVECPLIDYGLTKADVLSLVARAGLVLPLMYLLGFANANCIGCVKGGEGYWRAIREVFPEQFEVIALLQGAIGPGAYFLRFRSGPRKGERMSLRELPPGKANRAEPLPSCSFFCEAAERAVAENNDQPEVA